MLMGFLADWKMIVSFVLIAIFIFYSVVIAFSKMYADGEATRILLLLIILTLVFKW